MSTRATRILCTVPDLLLRQAGPLVRKTAVVDARRRITYDELIARSLAYAALLKESGVRKGDRVCMFLERSVDAVALLFATWFCGGVAVVANANLAAPQLEHILSNSEASCLVSDGSRLRRTAEVVSRHNNVIDLDVVNPSATSFAPERIIGSDLAQIAYTAASTGPAKGVMLSHNNLLDATRIVSDCFAIGSSDVLLSVLPFSFDYALNHLLASIATGATIVIETSSNPADICNTLAATPITGLPATAALWKEFAAEGSPFLAERYPNLRFIASSGGKLPQDSIAAIRAAHPRVKLYVLYGSTESSRSTCLFPESLDSRPGSIGKPMANIDVLVVNAAGSACKPGEIGELVHRGAGVAMGYWRDPVRTGRTFRPHPLQYYLNGREEIVVFSGDLVKTDEDGYLYYIGRKEQQIKAKGVSMSPEEIETLIASSNLVARVCAFGVRFEGIDDVVLAVVPREPDRFRQEDLDVFCRTRLPEHMRPRAIMRVDALPLTPNGKADRLRVREMFRPPSSH
ncbi:MAG TPA: AMP-binding protein [Thermoanaerobaculia bacterium]